MEMLGMSYRPIVLAATVAALLTMHVASAQAQPAYVPRGGMYIGPGAGPVYVTPAMPRYGNGYGSRYEEPDYGYEPEPAPYGYRYRAPPVTATDTDHRLVMAMDTTDRHPVMAMADHRPVTDARLGRQPNRETVMRLSRTCLHLLLVNDDQSCCARWHELCRESRRVGGLVSVRMPQHS
jgi:hypothetical protein